MTGQIKIAIPKSEIQNPKSNSLSSSSLLRGFLNNYTTFLVTSLDMFFYLSTPPLAENSMPPPCPGPFIIILTEDNILKTPRKVPMIRQHGLKD